MPLTDKQARFCAEFLVDLCAAKAAVRAGYSERTAAEQGYQLLAVPEIAATIEAAQAERAARTQLSADWVLSRLREVAERAMQAEPVRDRDGNPTGEFRFDGSTANRSLELLGRHLGLFGSKVEVTGAGGGPLMQNAAVEPERLERALQFLLARQQAQTIDATAVPTIAGPED